MPAGRPPGPTKLTPQIVEKICEGVRIGLQYEQAAIRAGINPRTFFRWKSAGDQAMGGVYYNFCQSLKEAEVFGEAANLIHLQNHGTQDKPGKWQPLAWILERRHPQRWALPDSKARQELDLESLSAIADLLKQAGASEPEQGDKKAGSRRDSGPNKRDDAKGKRRK